MKTLIFMRTHYIDDAVISEYKKLKNSLSENEDILLFIDNHTNFLNTDKHGLTIERIGENSEKCFLYDKFIHESLKLPYYTDDPNNTDLGQVMWYCSDFPLYIVRKYLPDYDYYWSIESDVFCNGNTYKVFFDKYRTNSDLIIHDFRDVSIDPGWAWQNLSDWVYYDMNKYGGFFPILRVSGEALDFLYQRRLEHAKLFEKAKNIGSNRWIYCELFVPTELANNGFACQGLETENLRYFPEYNLNKQRIFENPDFKLYHPVK